MHEASPFLTPSLASFIARRLSQPARVGGWGSPCTSLGGVKNLGMRMVMGMATMILFAIEMTMAMMSMSMSMSMCMIMNMRIQNDFDHGDNPKTCFWHFGT